MKKWNYLFFFNKYHLNPPNPLLSLVLKKSYSIFLLSLFFLKLFTPNPSLIALNNKNLYSSFFLFYLVLIPSSINNHSSYLKLYNVLKIIYYLYYNPFYKILAWIYAMEIRNQNLMILKCLLFFHKLYFILSLCFNL